MKKVWLLSVLVLLVGVGSAEARTTIVVEDGEADYPYQRWVDRMKVPTINEAITIAEHPSPAGNPIATSPNSQIIWLDADHPYYARAGLRHELGHRYDYALLSDPLRERFKQIIHDRRTGWRFDAAHYNRLGTRENPPIEVFADVYWICSRTLRIGAARLEPVGVKPITPPRHRRACRFIRLAARTASVD